MLCFITTSQPKNRKENFLTILNFKRVKIITKNIIDRFQRKGRIWTFPKKYQINGIAYQRKKNPA